MRTPPAWTDGVALSVDDAVRLALDAADLAKAHNRDSHAETVSRDSTTLTARERDVASLVGRGCTNRQIADRLLIAPRTAETHVFHILGKLKLHTRAELAVWSVTNGLTSNAGPR